MLRRQQLGLKAQLRAGADEADDQAGEAVPTKKPAAKRAAAKKAAKDQVELAKLTKERKTPKRALQKKAVESSEEQQQEACVTPPKQEMTKKRKRASRSSAQKGRQSVPESKVMAESASSNLSRMPSFKKTLKKRLLKKKSSKDMEMEPAPMSTEQTAVPNMVDQDGSRDRCGW